MISEVFPNKEAHYEHHDALFYIFKRLSITDLKVVSIVCKRWREITLNQSLPLASYLQTKTFISFLNDSPKVIESVAFEYDKVRDRALFYEGQLEYLNLVTLERKPSSLFPEEDDGFSFILSREKYLVAVSHTKICIYDANEKWVFRDDIANPDLKTNFAGVLCDASEDWLAISYPKTGNGMVALKNSISLYHLSTLKKCEITFACARVCAMALSSKYLVRLENEDNKCRLHVHNLENGRWKLNASLAQTLIYNEEVTLKFISEEHIFFEGSGYEYLIKVTEGNSEFLKGRFLSHSGDWMACQRNFQKSTKIDFYQICTYIERTSDPLRTLVRSNEEIYKTTFMCHYHFLIATRNFLEVWDLETATLLKMIKAPYIETGIKDPVIFKNDPETGTFLAFSTREKFFHWGLKAS